MTQVIIKFNCLYVHLTKVVSIYRRPKMLLECFRSTYVHTSCEHIFDDLDVDCFYDHVIQFSHADMGRQDYSLMGCQQVFLISRKGAVFAKIENSDKCPIDILRAKLEGFFQKVKLDFFYHADVNNCLKVFKSN